MEAGRELDAQIAEKVMDYALTGIAKSDGESLGLDFESEDWQVLPQYSTDISAAWKVVEKLGLAVIPDGNEWLAGILDGQFNVEEPRGNGYIDVTVHDGAYAPTAALAICRSALLVTAHASS